MTTQAHVNQVTALIRLGELAMDLHRADDAMKQARAAYHAEVKKFEMRRNGGERIKVDANDPLYARCCLYTREEFLEFEAAKKKAYRAKRKLFKECEKSAGGAP